MQRCRGCSNMSLSVCQKPYLYNNTPYQVNTIYNQAVDLRPNLKVPNIHCFVFTGQIQEKEEKEAQETRQEKEKEGSVSVRLRA